jgi:hypothetical protein
VHDLISTSLRFFSGSDSKGQVEIADDRLVQEFDAGGVDANVVGRPPDSEFIPAGG